jgi:ribosomal protein L11 methylase PrmA
VGIDIDVDCCRIANANAVQNQVQMRNYVPPLLDDDDDDDETKKDHEMSDDVVGVDNESKSLLLKAHRYALQELAQRNESGHDLILPKTSTDTTTTTNEGPLWGGPVWAEQSFDIGVANILALPLVGLARTLYRMMRPGAVVGLSGILSHQADMVVQAYQNAGFVNVQVERERNDWILVTCRRRLSNE